ncbi:hypothetical protein GmHk_12G034978 [Glycine max]|nr:hypothetical protein GmHk_12G034978 [Glycine max]
MLRNFTDCAIMLPFDSRHVAELHGLSNDGCQVPRSGQAKVASHQTDGPRTKLGSIRNKSFSQEQVTFIALLSNDPFMAVIDDNISLWIEKGLVHKGQGIVGEINNSC